MEDVHVYIERPAEKEDADLEEVGDALRGLEHVSAVEVNSEGNVVAVSYEGGKAEREEIKRAIEGAGYGVSRLSLRSEIEDVDRSLWDI